MYTIQQINAQIRDLKEIQHTQEKELFNKLENLLINASPMNILSNTLNNFISKNQIDQELPKVTIRFIVNNLSDRYLSKSPVLKNALQSMLSDFIIDHLFEKKSKSTRQISTSETIVTPEKVAEHF